MKRKNDDRGSHALRGSGRKKAAGKKEKHGISSWDFFSIRLKSFFSEKVPGFFHALRLPDKKYMVLICAALAAVILIVLSALSINSDRNDYKYYMSQAADFYGSGDYDGALGYLRRAASIEAKDECILMMADCYEAQGNINKAIEALQRLKSDERSILRRIAALEKQKAEQIKDEKISLMELNLSPDEKTLNLDGMGIDDAALQTLKEFRQTTKLSLSGNNISDISPLSELKGLVSLNLADNEVSDVSPLSELKGLRNLRLDNNPLEDISPLKKLTTLRTLSLRGVGLSEAEVTELGDALPGCAVFAGSGEDDPAYINIGGTGFYSDISALDLSGKNISDISALTNCRNLKRLILRDNSISDLTPIMNNPELSYLDISNNLVADLRPLMGLENLRSLIADNNHISSTAALGGKKKLIELSLSNNPLGDLSGIPKLEAMQRLTLNNTGLKDEDLDEIEKLGKISYLSIKDNPLLSGEEVEMLQINLHCYVDHSPLVYSVRIAGETVKGSSKEVNLSDRDISDISELGKLMFLESLNLSGNKISNIYIFQFAESRESIKYLNLSGNEIEDITPVASLPNLESLDLTDNKVNSVLPLMNLKNLRLLKLGGNRLTEEQLKLLRDNLSGCEIISD